MMERYHNCVNNDGANDYDSFLKIYGHQLSGRVDQMHSIQNLYSYSIRRLANKKKYEKKKLKH